MSGHRAAAAAARRAAAKPAAVAADTIPLGSDSGSDNGGGGGGDASSGEEGAPRPSLAAALSRVAPRRAAAGGGGDATAAGAAGRVVYLGHIPHGFYEEQMRGFFAQFGDVARLRLARSKKTGRSRHYAFIEFAVPVVASVVAETMNGYVLDGRRLVCHVMEAGKVHARLFDGAGRVFRALPRRHMERARMNKKKEPAAVVARVRGLLAAEKKKRARLAALGIECAAPRAAPLAARRLTRPCAARAGMSLAGMRRSSRARRVARPARRRRPNRRPRAVRAGGPPRPRRRAARPRRRPRPRPFP